MAFLVVSNAFNISLGIPRSSFARLPTQECMKCERKVQRPLLILAPLFFIINSPVTGVGITQVPVPMTNFVTI